MKRFLLATTLMFFLGTAGAFATVELQLCSGTCTSIIVGSGGVVSYDGGVGGTVASPNWDVSLADGTSGSPMGTLGLVTMDAIGIPGAPPLTITVTDNNFTQTSDSFAFDLAGTAPEFGTGTAKFSGYYSNTNTDFATTNLIGTLTADTFGQVFSGVGDTGPYSLTEVLTLTSTSGSTSTQFFTTASVTAAEPSSAAVLFIELMAVLSLVLALRWRIAA